VNYRKIETPENFRYMDSLSDGLHLAAGEGFKVSLEDRGSDVYRYSVESKRWPLGTGCHTSFEASSFGDEASSAGCSIGEGGAPRLELDGVELLAPSPGRGLGVCGAKWLLAFAHDPQATRYGMGEKSFGMEVSGRRTRFWNTDLWADFDFPAVNEYRADPLYVSLPVLWIRKADRWLVLVIESPIAPFMNTGAVEGIFSAGAGEGAMPFRQEFSLGARGGAPAVWILAGRDPAVLVRRLSTLVGRPPLPPLWALGHQQCRWGYRSFDQLDAIASEYEARAIPNDGLWLDIDSMDGFRVFTTDPTRFGNAEQRLADLKARGFNVVPILDPGIRRDPEFSVYREAIKRQVLCKTPEGIDYTGFVWPGYAVFPDFALPEGREFWAQEVERFTKLGFDGYWIDMNDPSTGSAPLDDMLFAGGTLPHEAYHNDYALGMAEATREGLKRARPGLRPFVVSRSGSLGISRHAAVWTGDNVSNEAHLRASIPVSLTMSISGVPWNGADVPGFGGDASADLMRAWYKAGFLFPFFRNHCIAGARDQEPWTRGARTERVVAGMIKSRYLLLPYLYNLFIDQSERGDPVLRPLWLADPSPECALIADEFLVGPAILQAPILAVQGKSREAWLPQGNWFDLSSSTTLPGRQKIIARQGWGNTPIWLASPAILPLAGKPSLRASTLDLATVDFLLILADGESTESRYRWDDGATDTWAQGARGEARLTAFQSGKTVEATLDIIQAWQNGITMRIIMPVQQGTEALTLNGKTMKLHRTRLGLAGHRFPVLATASIRLA
jgi:alpha-glucosidase